MFDSKEGGGINTTGSIESYKYAWTDGAFLHEMPSKKRAMAVARDLSETQGYDTQVLEKRKGRWIIIKEYKGGRISFHNFGKEMY